MNGAGELLLVIDTSAGTSVAVVDGERGILSEANGFDTMKHAEVIGRLIEQAIAEAGISVGDLTAVVAGMGPGPFTGLRVGIAAARTFALGAGVDVLPVVSHDAIALARQLAEAGADQTAAETRAAHSNELLVVSDARRREVYWSLYRLDSPPVRLDGPGLAKPEALPHEHAARVDAAHVSAGALGLVALSLQRTGGQFATDQALYLRSPDVTISTGVKRVTQ